MRALLSATACCLLLCVAACDDPSKGADDLSSLPALTSVTASPEDLLLNRDTVHVVVQGDGLETVASVTARVISDTDYEGEEVELVASGNGYEGDLPVQGAFTDLAWISVEFDHEVQYWRASAGDANYTRIYSDSSCTDCPQSTELPLATVNIHQGNEVVVGQMSGTFTNTVGGGGLFYFVPTTSEAHRITVIPVSGNVLLDGCTSLPCGPGAGAEVGQIGHTDPLGTRVGGLVATSVTAGETYYLRVTGLEAGEFAVLVEDVTTLPLELLYADEVAVDRTLEPATPTTLRVFPPAMGIFTIFVFDRSDRSATWTVFDAVGGSTLFSGPVDFEVEAFEPNMPIELSIQQNGSAAITFDLVMVEGTGTSSATLNAGANALDLAPASGPHLLSFTAATASTHTFTASSAVMEVNFELFEDSGLTTPVTFGAGNTLCSHQAASGNTECTTTNALAAGTTYYLRVTAQSQEESWGTLDLQVATP